MTGIDKQVHTEIPPTIGGIDDGNNTTLPKRSNPLKGVKLPYLSTIGGYDYSAYSKSSSRREVATGDDRTALVQLDFNDGREFEYRVGYQDNKTYPRDTR